MDVTEQEILFAAVKKRWPHWNNRAASGYVKGVVDGLRLDEPDTDQTYSIDRHSLVSKAEFAYAIAYFQGFLDAHGAGAVADWWMSLARGLEFSGPWWEHDETKTVMLPNGAI